MHPFIKIFVIGSLVALTGCTTTVVPHEKPRLQYVEQKILNLNVQSSKIVGLSTINTFCEDIAELTPKEALTGWYKHHIKTQGKEGDLTIIVNGATLEKVELDGEFNCYHGIYDVTFKISSSKHQDANTIELNVMVENERQIHKSHSKREIQAILRAQVEEMIKLLESEVIDQSAVYFADYLVK